MDLSPISTLLFFPFCDVFVLKAFGSLISPIICRALDHVSHLFLVWLHIWMHLFFFLERRILHYYIPACTMEYLGTIQVLGDLFLKSKFSGPWCDPQWDHFLPFWPNRRAGGRRPVEMSLYVVSTNPCRQDVPLSPGRWAGFLSLWYISLAPVYAVIR